ncbi:MAG: DNA-methyltransferase [Nitrospiraceae bacterium]
MTPAQYSSNLPGLRKSGSLVLSRRFTKDADVVLSHGDCLEFLKTLPTGIARLVVTSPPYNIGKSYERRRKLDEYLKTQEQVIKECTRVLADDGSICWQVGNYVSNSEIVPLDIALWPIFNSLGLKMRNRIIWHFEHGLHCSRRLSGRYETIVWFTKADNYVFNLDLIRVPQKYPGKKHFKGPKAGQYSCNPLGKNPGDLWVIPNVKHNHVEKTIHPCQFPVELIERLIIALTKPGDRVLDPYMGVGTTAVAAVRHGRRALGAEIIEEYVSKAEERVELAVKGLLRTRPMNRPVYVPRKSSSTVKRQLSLSTL